MKITINQFDAKLNEYVSDVLIPSFHNPLYIFTASGALAANLITITKYLDKLQTLGVVCDGTVDTDKLDTFVEAGFRAVPTIDFMGVKFSLKDYQTFRDMF